MYNASLHLKLREICRIRSYASGRALVPHPPLQQSDIYFGDMPGERNQPWDQNAGPISPSVYATSTRTHKLAHVVYNVVFRVMLAIKRELIAHCAMFGNPGNLAI